jgi:hypothetical protein
VWRVVLANVELPFGDSPPRRGIANIVSRRLRTGLRINP